MASFYGAKGEFSKRTEEAYGAFQNGKTQSFLEKTFGPVGEFDLYANAFGALTGAVGSALTAWIDQYRLVREKQFRSLDVVLQSNAAASGTKNSGGVLT